MVKCCFNFLNLCGFGPVNCYLKFTFTINNIFSSKIKLVVSLNYSFIIDYTRLTKANFCIKFKRKIIGAGINIKPILRFHCGNR